jgi:hypothetical protein
MPNRVHPEMPDIVLTLIALTIFALWYYRDRAIGAGRLPTKNVVPMRGHLPIIGSLKTAIKINET